MTAIELTSLISSIAALILAILAIALSIIFFRMSSELSKTTTEAARGIGSSVDRLEKLFDKLYADTFSMMRDTVSDMRKHIWPDESGGSEKLGEEAEKLAENKISTLKKRMDDDIAQILQQQQITDERLGSLQSGMRGLIERAITDSRRLEVEAREETLRRRISVALRILKRRYGDVTAKTLVDNMPSGFPRERVLGELQDMDKEGIVELHPPGSIEPDTLVRLLRR